MSNRAGVTPLKKTGLSFKTIKLFCNNILHKPCFPNLARPTNYQWLTTRRIFPACNLFFSQSLHVIFSLVSDVLVQSVHQTTTAYYFHERYKVKVVSIILKLEVKGFYFHVARQLPSTALISNTPKPLLLASFVHFGTP